MHTQIENVTPQIAAAYLSQNTNNRPLNKGRVEAYAAAMSRGEWQFNGDPIRFSEQGILIDGQHRLSAIVQSNAPQKMLIIRDLPQSTFKTIDVGAIRSAGDLAALVGVKNSNLATSGARIYLTWQQSGTMSIPIGKRPTNSQIVDFVASEEIVHRAASYVAGSIFLRKFLPPSVSCFLYLAFSTVSEEKAIAFLNELKEPTVIDWHSPIFLLRERLTQSSMGKVKLRKNELIALMMKAWRSWLKGAKVKQLKVSTLGNRTEKDIYRVQ